MNAPAVPDALAQRLAELREGRQRPDWHARLLALARDLTMADGGAVLAVAEDGLSVLAPEGIGEVPEAWQAVARAALAAQGVAQREAGPGAWLMAVALDAQSVLALMLPTISPVDRALTRERLAMLAALAQSSSAIATMAALAPGAAAAEAAGAMLAETDPARGLAAAAAQLGRLLPPGTQLALGLVRRGRVVRLALSDQPVLDGGGALARALSAAMEESLDAGEPRVLPDPARASAARSAFPDALADKRLLAVPGRDGRAAAVVLWHEAVPHPALQVAALLQPGLGLVARAAARPGTAHVARRHAFRAWPLVAVAAAVGVLAVLPREDEVVASFVAQPAVVQAVTAPFDGVLDSSDIRPGDSVAAGAVLAKLSTRELSLEIAAIRARAANDLREAAIARAAGQPAQEMIAELSARRSAAQLALLEYRVSLAEVRAPIAGVVMAGDLRRNLGQALARGQAMFEIAPAGDLRAEILLPETRAHLVEAGQVGWLAPAADPSARLRVTIERIRPMAEIVQGRNVFRAVAVLDDPAAVSTLRPGAEGVARVEVGETTWLAWALRDPIIAVRRWLWL